MEGIGNRNIARYKRRGGSWRIFNEIKHLGRHPSCESRISRAKQRRGSEGQTRGEGRKLPGRNRSICTHMSIGWLQEAPVGN
jgi:hypothetical protein